MKKFLIGLFSALLLISCASAQCTPASPSPGTVCLGPLTTKPPLTGATQSAFILEDIGLAPPVPTAKAYILSIVDGTIQESDNAGVYHTLVGPIGPQGPIGLTGQQGLIGPQGAAGIQGAIGSQGTIGLQGPQGVAGAAGAAGIQGAIGPQGIVGIQGSVGPQGSQGIQGVPGVAVGKTLVGDVTCPKGNGTVNAGWKTTGCKFYITAIQ